MKWSGSQVCVCFCECKDWRGLLLKAWGSPGQVLKRPWGLEVNRETCVYVCEGFMCVSDWGVWTSSGSGAAALAAHMSRYWQWEIPRIQRSDTGQSGCLSPAAGGSCVVHTSVFPTNGPSSWSARAGHWLRPLCCLCLHGFCISVCIDLCSRLCVCVCRSVLYICLCRCPLTIHAQPHYLLDLGHGAVAVLPLLDDQVQPLPNLYYH